MLDFLRKASTGWMAKILIALLILSFAVWGISGSILYGNQNTVAQVGSTSVSSQDFRFAYENQLNAFSQQVGRRLTRQEADVFGLRQTVLTQVVAGALLDENAKNMKLGVSEENLAKTIASDDTFSDLSGNFSRGTLRATLRQYGITEQEYIESRKRVALRNQIEEGTSTSLNMPTAFSNALDQFRNEERVFEYVEIGPEIVEEKPVPQQSDLEQYFETNKARFVAPQYRKLNIIKIETSDLAKPDEITDEDVKAEYENRKDGLRSPEKRRIEQLVLANADEAKEIKAKLDGGESFESVVEGLGKKVADLSLGILQRPDLPDENVANAAFEAELNKPTDIVEGIFGPVIVRVTEIEKEKTTAFEEVEDQLRQDVALRIAGDRLFEIFDLVEDERAAGEGIVETAQRLELDSLTIEALDQRGEDKSGNAIPNIPNLAALAQQAFQAQPGDDTEPVEIGNNGYIWFEVAEVIPERQKDLDEVKADVEQSWISDTINKQVADKATTIKEAIENGGNFETVLADNLPVDSLGQAVKPSTSTQVKRNDQSAGISAELISAGFSIAKGKITTAALGNEKHAVLKVSQIISADGKGVPEDQITTLNASASTDILSQVVEDLQSRESVSINQNAIEAAFNPYGGNAGHGGM